MLSVVARRLLERMSRNIVLERRLPKRLGGARIFVTPDSALRFWSWSVESAQPLLLRWAERHVHVGDTLWDVGANVGVFAAAAASRAGPHGRVVAIEPDLCLAQLLQRTARARGDSMAPIVVLSCAVAETLEPRTLNIAARGRSGNHLDGVSHSSQTGGVRASALVMTVTLDWMLEPVAP